MYDAGWTLSLPTMPEITSRLSTALADRYKLESHLGEGGMMPLVEGDTLRDKLDFEKQLGVDETIEIAKGVAAVLCG